MNIRDFIKDKILYIMLLAIGIITIEIFLIPYNFGNFIKIYIPASIGILYFIGFAVEYFTKKSYYDNLDRILDELNEKYLITEIINTPNFLEGKILKEKLFDIDKSMIENVNKYKYMGEDYKEYIELWIHEIKIPIATSKMIIENNKNEITKSIDEELDKVENYTEQALFYARSNTVEKDYYIKKVLLKDIVGETIKKNKNVLIQEKTLLNLHNLDLEVNTDSKWIIFILNQIIQNSIKYKKIEEHLEIEIYAKKEKEKVILYIKDNGIGIEKAEVKKVFEKGFTGKNGRLLNKKSTGIGLYLCKKLCNKLGISIALISVKNEGTEVQLIFPKGSHVNLN